MRAWNGRDRSQGKCGARRDLVFIERKECLNLFKHVPMWRSGTSSDSIIIFASASRGVTKAVGVQIPLVWALPVGRKPQIILEVITSIVLQKV